jgi:hypothetical protein
MKATFLVLVAVASLNSARAQGSFQLTNYLTSPTALFVFGEGTYSLTDNVLSYNLRTDFGFSEASIYGPAGPGMDAPLLFELRLRFCNPPLGGHDRGGCFYRGTLSLSEEQINELIGEQWYVLSSEGPGGATLRGQILLVPEPSGLLLSAAAGLALVARALQRGYRSSRGLARPSAELAEHQWTTRRSWK